MAASAGLSTTQGREDARSDTLQCLLLKHVRRLGHLKLESTEPTLRSLIVSSASERKEKAS